MKNKPSKILSGVTLLLLLAAPVLAEDRQVLKGAIPPQVATLDLQPTDHLQATNLLHLSLGLGLHNRPGLTNLLQQLYDPASANFHRYLTMEKFTEQFGPTKAEYQQVLDFAKTNGFTVRHTYGHRRLVNVTATVSDIEKAFHVHLYHYNHPTENRLFYAPDVPPTFDPGVPIQTVSGLNNYTRPQPAGHPQKGEINGTGGRTIDGSWSGTTLRKAFTPGVTATGAGQSVGLVEFDGYYTNDILAYESSNNLPNVPLINVIEGGSAQPDGNINGVLECSLDIELVIAMAPGLSEVYIFEGDPPSFSNPDGSGDFDDVLSAMAGSPSINQFSSSWSGSGFDGYIIDNSSGDDSLQQMAAQGQTFFQASGDGDAYNTSIQGPSDATYAISVGGTSLQVDANTNYLSESVWNSGFQVPGWGNNGDGTLDGTNGGWWGSGGGVSQNYGIPPWQQTIGAQHLNAVGGSTTQRNVPDVAMPAVNIFVLANNGANTGAEGTSLAAPLWAGFIALANQEAAGRGQPPVGFLSPAFCIIGESPLYTNAFHDITNGNDFWPGSPSLYTAAPGYDLCTGWGTPNGQGMIDALLNFSGQTWVNFSAGGCPGNGSYANPFCTLASGVTAVPSQGTICLIGPNSSFVGITITNAMTLRAFYGQVSIGQQ